MEYAEYKEKALTTAVYPKEYGKIYTILGLGNEIGEAGGKLKKMIRGDGIEPKAFTDELGDVLWYMVATVGEFGLSLSGKLGSFTSATKVGGEFEINSVSSVFLYFTRVANKYMDACLSNQLYFASIYLSMMLDLFETLCMVSGTRPLKIAQANLSKLASRAERDVLKGDGDNR